MRSFVRHLGTIVPLDRTSVDTDAIIPADYCKTVKRTGFAEHVFAEWRQERGFVLDQPARQGATVLVAGSEFGTGSSREHAVWALQDWGFEVVISSRFGDIFYNNCAKAGLVAAVIDGASARALLDHSTSDPGLEVLVDLESRLISWPAADGSRIEVDIEMDDHTRHRFLNGLDDIDLTTRHERLIRDYEERHAERLPTILDA